MKIVRFLEQTTKLDPISMLLCLLINKAGMALVIVAIIGLGKNTITPYICLFHGRTDDEAIVEFQRVEHFDILPIGSGIDGDTAYYTSGIQGSYRDNGEAWTAFLNGSWISTPFTQYGSEHWLLKKTLSAVGLLFEWISMPVI